MAGLRLILRTAPDQRCDLSPLLPSRLAGLDRAAIERIAIGTTRVALHVGDLFRVRTGDAADLAIEGGSDRFDDVGAEMTEGSLLLDGTAGQRAGRRMAGGRLEIRGSAGPFAASGMRGGALEIGGDAGDLLGAPLAGERTGMEGGVVAVRGNAGARAGDRLRRGLIVVEGRAGDAPGSRMIAGTLVACGGAGALPGYLMRRGTLLLAARGPALPPTFLESGTIEGSVFQRLLVRALLPVSPLASRLAARGSRRFLGDAATLGKGEVLLAE